MIFFFTFLLLSLELIYLTFSLSFSISLSKGHTDAEFQIKKFDVTAIQFRKFYYKNYRLG